MLKLTHSLLNHILAHAREDAPQECCGLIGGAATGKATSVYRTRNVAATPLVTYEAASKDPQPSETDVRLAYYPSAVYLIVGLGSEEPCMRAFRISERAGSWEAAEF